MAEPVTPPHSVEAEQSVLGALLMDNAAFDEVGTRLRPTDFYLAEHSTIYSTIVGLLTANKLADVVTVYDRMRGDLAYLNALAQSVPSASAARAYADIVRERSMRRQAMRIARQLLDDAARGTDQSAPLSQVLGDATTALLSLAQSGTAAREPVELDRVLVAFIDDLQARAAGEVRTLPMGLVDLDHVTAGGGRRGELWVVGARPSMGKTAFVLQLCRSLGVDYQVLLLSQEDSLLSAAARLVAAAGGVNLADIRNPMKASASLWEGVSNGLDALMPLHLALDDQTGLVLADVRRKAQQVRRRSGRLDVLIVDYLQLMDDGGENRSIGLGRIANGLKRLAKELDVWVVLLSQLKREADERNGPPQMGDLRDSGDIEGAADTIGLLYREYMRKPTDENQHWAEMHLCKQKNGPTATINLFFDGAYQRFGDWVGLAPRRQAKVR